MYTNQLAALAAMSNQYGANPEFVLAGGGNTSFKNADRLCVRAADALPLSALTEGVHVHNIAAPSEAQAEEVRRRLAEKGYLMK